LSLTDYGTLSFDKPDYETFDCLTAFIKAITQGGTKPAIVNGANEVAVAAFLDGKIKFLEIGELVTEALENIDGKDITCVDDVLEADNTAREYVRKLIIEREK
jgi:1-deoxy-D-xylulose-5-phosphate reductoisomerase